MMLITELLNIIITYCVLCIGINGNISLYSVSYNLYVRSSNDNIQIHWKAGKALQNTRRNRKEILNEERFIK